MSRLSNLAGLLLRAAQTTGRNWSGIQGSLALEATPAGRVLGNFLGVSSYKYTTSSSIFGAHAPAASGVKPGSIEPARKYRPLADKELWHEAWMYEDKFGTETDPIIVPSLEAERIIGVTDPEDDNLVVWGILRENEGPRQFIEGGEFYLLKKVPYVTKVGDVLEAIEASKAGTPLPK